MTFTLFFVGLLAIAAIARVTRLITADTITAPLRAVIERWRDGRQIAEAEARKNAQGSAKKPDDVRTEVRAAHRRAKKRLARAQTVVEFIHCPWCVSVWTAAGAVILLFAYNSSHWPWQYTAHQWFLCALTTFAFSFLAVTLLNVTENDDETGN